MRMFCSKFGEQATFHLASKQSNNIVMIVRIPKRNRLEVIWTRSVIRGVRLGEFDLLNIANILYRFYNMIRS
jgi:hypothetical protein